ncbi:hypothetical protein ACIQOU_32930 [Streptomyces sp. NPDC091279]|uniref:hypothetical protein n=1 Tax=Streptomyces sp. NPDC091279 TaxID=3365983 RepID=UPI0037FF1A51
METRTATDAGTIGADVLTVHRLITLHNGYGAPYRWPRCGAGNQGDLVTEWLRRINCPACLATGNGPTDTGSTDAG